MSIEPRQSSFQFTIGDACAWTASVAVSAALWKVHPLLTVLMLFWSIPAVFRHQALCRVRQFSSFRRGVWFFACVVEEGLISCIAAIGAGMLGALVTIVVAVFPPEAFYPALPVFALLGAIACLGTYVAGYEFLRRKTWPRDFENSQV